MDENPLDLIDPSIVNEDEILTELERIYEAAPDTRARSMAIENACMQIAQLSEIEAEHIINTIQKKYKQRKKLLLELITRERKRLAEISSKAQQKDDEETDMDDEEIQRQGFWSFSSSYYFNTKDGPIKVSNFIIKPLYHIYSKTDNKRLIEVRNEHGATKILDIPSKNMISLDLFQQWIFGEGHFIFFGNKHHFIRILDKISRNLPLANELRTLGWQREGFYALANGIFYQKWQPVNEYGITEHKGKNYFSAAFSVVYSDVREDDDEYENDRFFTWTESPITFTQWCQQIMKVYTHNGAVAIAFLVAALFRDMIYEKYKIFPHLFLFGEKQSGKSQLAWSLSNVFFNNLPAFNLSSGTQVGFFRRLSRVKNAACWFDEYSNDIDEKRFQSLKSAYDGMGHEKGKMSRDNRTEISKVNSACIISGQYLPTRDDNALFTRSILLSFEKKNYTAAEMEQYNYLKKIEENGLSSIIAELLPHRAVLEKRYIKEFSLIYDSMKNDLAAQNKPFDERFIRNFSSILTPVKIFSTMESPVDFGFEYKTLYDQSLEKVAQMSFQIANSEAVSTFWNMIEFMLDNKMITPGEDYKIETTFTVLELRNRQEQAEKFDFTRKDESLIYFRFTKIHPLYMEAHRKQYGKNGVDLVSLIHYLKNHRAFLGTIKSTRFTNTNTSAFVFRYKLLSVNLERLHASEHSEIPREQPNNTGVQSTIAVSENDGRAPF